MHRSVIRSGFAGFLGSLFGRRDRVVFVTTRKRAATREYEAKKAKTTADLRAFVAGRAL